MLTLARCPYPFVWHAVASRSDVPGTVLIALLDRHDSEWNDNALLNLVARNPRADRAVLDRALQRVEGSLAVGHRPYAAGLALAARTELPYDERRRLLTAGGSRRFRAGIRRVLQIDPLNQPARRPLQIVTACAERGSALLSRP